MGQQVPSQTGAGLALPLGEDDVGANRVSAGTDLARRCRRPGVGVDPDLAEIQLQSRGQAGTIGHGTGQTLSLRLEGGA